MSSPESPKVEHRSRSRESLKSVMSRKRQELKMNPAPEPSEPIVADPYANASGSNYVTRGRTAYVCDPEVQKHKCEWDEYYPEGPFRLDAVMDRIRHEGLLELCYELPNPYRNDLCEKVCLKHTKEHYDRLKDLCRYGNAGSMENAAGRFDAVYFNRYTFDAACRSLSSVLNLVFAVAKHEVQNGMAFVRPPGHHAMREEYNGYCFFNNVAIAAEAVIQEGFSRKVLIVDVDVHHGQGIQQMFYDRRDVLYFSIHRYEHGCFWPNLLESNFHCAGKGEGLGYNINVPLNATGLTDHDYLSIVFSILLPVAYEFNPDVIILCAGYDSCIGDEKGQMNVTPAFYSHLVSLLSGVARGRIAVVLEGGYFLPSLAEGACMTLKSLLGGPCPMIGPISNIHPSVVDTICNVRRTLCFFWTCFKVCEFKLPSEVPHADPNEHKYQICYYGEPEKPPYQTRNCYPVNSDVEYDFYTKIVDALQEKYKAQMYLPVYYVYDEKMLKHKPPVGQVERPERPERVTGIITMFADFGVDKRLEKKPIYVRDYIDYAPHAPNFFETIKDTLKNLPQTKDVYMNEHTQESVKYAVSGVLTLADAIMTDKCRAGIAIVRPPGHHAEYDKPLGFCFINNIAVAANYIQKRYGVARILIVDFDVHHGNGTQNAFYHTNNVMYISIHKDEDGRFFPANSPRGYTYDGHGMGKGYNINIPFNNDKMADTEYLAAFHNIVLPAAYSFAPQVVLVSAGFDAGVHDPLGAYGVSPETFGHFIQMLKSLAEGRLLLALEGGYNLTTTSYGMTICAKVLLGDPLFMPKDPYKTFSAEAVKSIRNVMNHMKLYHSIFKINKKLAHTPHVFKKVKRFNEQTYGTLLSKPIDADRVHDNEYIENEMTSLNIS